MFNSIIRDNKNCLETLIPLACSILKKKLTCPGYIVYTERNAKRCKSDSKNNRFEKLDGKIFALDK